MIPTMAELSARGETPEVLFWVGCTGSFDDRAKRIIRAFAHLLQKAGVRFAVLGTEESCTGDPAKRAGNDEHRSAQQLSGNQNSNHLSALFQHYQKRIPCAGRELRSNAPH